MTTMRSLAIYLRREAEATKPQTHNALFLSLSLACARATSYRLHYEAIGDIELPCLLVEKQSVIVCGGRYTIPRKGLQ